MLVFACFIPGETQGSKLWIHPGKRKKVPEKGTISNGKDHLPTIWAVQIVTSKWAAWMTIFPILNDEQRVATGWGLTTNQLIVVSYPGKLTTKFLHPLSLVDYIPLFIGFHIFHMGWNHQPDLTQPSIFRGHSFVEFSRCLDLRMRENFLVDMIQGRWVRIRG